MKALLNKAVGRPEDLVLEETADLVATPGHVVIDVAACGVNFPDALILEDKYQVKPERPFSPGCEVSGVVRSVGEGVTHVAVGDRVLAGGSYGGMAEQALMRGTRTFRIPDAMPFDEAAAFMMTFGTSWYALHDRGQLKAGDTLLILGAAGGVGAAAIALGKIAGARVIAAVSTAEKAAFCESLGADEALVYPRAPFDAEARRALAAQFKAAVGEAGADVIYDAIGDDYAEPALRSIAWGGRYLVVGFAAGQIPKIPLNLPLLKNCQIVGAWWGGWLLRDPQAFAESGRALLELYSEGKIRPHISARFPLEQGAEAIRELADRRVLGKVIVEVR
jgi:NADPH2:quinone reductase